MEINLIITNTLVSSYRPTSIPLLPKKHPSGSPTHNYGDNRGGITKMKLMEDNSYIMKTCNYSKLPALKRNEQCWQ